MAAFVLLLILAAPAAAVAGKPGPRAQTAIRLNKGLAGTPMAGTGWALERAGWRWKIHPAFIAAIAGTESSFGAAACAQRVPGTTRYTYFNSFGLASCGRSWRVPHFYSWGHVYSFMGKFLTERWPGATSPYSYHGYAACDACWARRVSYFMRRLGFGTSVRYP